METEPTTAPDDPHGKLYWFCYHTWTGLKAFAGRNRTTFIVLAIAAVVLPLLLRAYWQHLVLGLRMRIYLFSVGLPLAAALWWLCWRRRGWGVRGVTVAVLGALFVALLVLDVRPQHYMALYLRYRSLNIVELKELPETAHDRVQPQNSIVSLANEAMNETETPASTQLVRIGNEYRWTIAIEPAYLIRRLMGGVHQLFSVSSTAPSPVFSSQNRLAVRFPTGEGLLLWHNTHVNTVRAFGLRRFLNYEPGEVHYIPDDRGEWVQVVSLVRWEGWFFPRPMFGGVQVFRQPGHDGIVQTVRRMLLGDGDWIRPNDIAKHSWLKGQNLLPVKVSRYIAHSLRFQSGFFAPLPGYHLGDIRIPHLPDDLHDQPFEITCTFPGHEAPDGLYDYFALEPYLPEKQGLNTSLFLPVEGTPIVYSYPHHKRNETLTGVSAISAKVMESRKIYDWTRNRPVEHRPYIKTVGGQRRFFWLTTVVTFKEIEGSYIAGSIPEVALTDAIYRTVTWVDPTAPEAWGRKLEAALAAIGSRAE